MLKSMGAITEPWGVPFLCLLSQLLIIAGVETKSAVVNHFNPRNGCLVASGVV